MVIQHPLLKEWQRELKSRHRLIEAGTGSVWLHQIRVKILRFFISRYGHETFSTTSDVFSHSVRRTQKAYFAAGTTGETGQPPKSHEVIRDLLQNIHRNVHSA